jgi:hypothetical protein
LFAAIDTGFQNSVSRRVVPLLASGLEGNARQTGGASFNAPDLKKASADQPGQRVFEVLRSHYTLTVSGNLAGEKLKVEVKRPEKVQVSALTLE